VEKPPLLSHPLDALSVRKMWIRDVSLFFRTDSPYEFLYLLGKLRVSRDVFPDLLAGVENRGVIPPPELFSYGGEGEVRQFSGEVHGNLAGIGDIFTTLSGPQDVGF